MAPEALDLTIGPPEDPQVDVAALDDFDTDFVSDDGTVPMVDEAVVRGVLAALGMGAHVVLGDDDVEDHWRFTPRELDELVPPLTRIANRRPKIRQAIMRGDEVTAGILLAGYAGRNVRDGKAAQKARDERDGRFPGEVERPTNGAAAAPGGAARWPGGGPGNGGSVRPATGGGVPR